MMKQAVLKFALILLISVQQPSFADSDSECNPAGNQSQMNACAEADFANSDRELNSAYKEIMQQASEVERTKLRSRQREWLKDRDPKCRAEANQEAEGGSMWPMIYQSCRARVTQERTKILKEQLRK